MRQDLYLGKYRRQTVRLKYWDYVRDTRYFFTICTKDRYHFFGQVVQGEMKLSDMGNIVYEEWIKTFEIRPYVSPDEFVVMPNHVHMIVNIDHGRKNGPICRGRGDGELSIGSGGPYVGGSGEAPPRRYVNDDLSEGKPVAPGISIPISPKSGSLGSIIGSYKSVCTKRIRVIGYDAFAWQGNYWESIIWDERYYRNIVRYIRNNPANWQKDRFYEEGCG